MAFGSGFLKYFTDVLKRVTHFKDYLVKMEGYRVALNLIKANFEDG